ncbi:unnamed protein product [Gulo gulo]|uniref:Uncharacterized protein n=1 Tax=Gulo gulo TaxID=48420 RepID=A0A9X9MD95_GULGU|nr:unnamed protein product [Gulo gulo]
MQRTDPGRGEAGDHGVMPSVPLRPSPLGPVGRPRTPLLCVLAPTTGGVCRRGRVPGRLSGEGRGRRAAGARG